MNITKYLESKNDFYYIVNPFEHNISNYDKSLDKIYTEYFPKPKDSLIITHNYYKIWEILSLFNITDFKELNFYPINNIDNYKDKNKDTNKDKMISNVDETIEAVINYRNKFYEKTFKINIIDKHDKKNHLLI